MKGIFKPNEAHLNEFKGRLFEFQVALELALLKKCHQSFFCELGGDYKRRLSRYEAWLRQNQPHLVVQLPRLAKACAAGMGSLLGSVDRVLVVGAESSWQEADLALYGNRGWVPVSLKLSRQGAFVHTKSAGVLSFITKYFPFGPAKALQDQLNQRVAASFYQMAEELHDLARLEFEGHFNRWRAVRTEHTGRLAAPFREIVLNHYQRVAGELYSSLRLVSRQPEFKRALFPLMGFSENRLMQVVCYHRGVETYRFAEVDILQERGLDSLVQSIRWGAPPAKRAGFEIGLAGRILRIRLKPMSKFTTLGLRVSCGLKKIETQH